MDEVWQREWSAKHESRNARASLSPTPIAAAAASDSAVHSPPLQIKRRPRQQTRFVRTMKTQRTAGDDDAIRTEAPQWAELPDDLLAIVRGMATSPFDRVRIAAVCRSWRAAAALSPAVALPTWLPTVFQLLLHGESPLLPRGRPGLHRRGLHRRPAGRPLAPEQGSQPGDRRLPRRRLARRFLHHSPTRHRRVPARHARNLQPLHACRGGAISEAKGHRQISRR
ncbi:hypothetical protein BRADI_4g11042v3 [Brachypodium distachyon]|uniref:F-box domain-containing protein n=1 Tax=Brachypodium distachyon TaxID=15368 RepID=A0A2K2CM21_BRADI|nr:hypothetical protein BRADI_4g11042v3 [Brachypodium distachyon]